MYPRLYLQISESVLRVTNKGDRRGRACVGHRRSPQGPLCPRGTGTLRFQCVLLSRCELQTNRQGQPVNLTSMTFTPGLICGTEAQIINLWGSCSLCKDFSRSAETQDHLDNGKELFALSVRLNCESRFLKTYI